MPHRGTTRLMEFRNGTWQNEINTRDFIVKNYTPYDGDESFLAPPTERTKALWDKLCEKMKEERARGGVYDIDEKTISTITAHGLHRQGFGADCRAAN